MISKKQLIATTEKLMKTQDFSSVFPSNDVRIIFHRLASLLGCRNRGGYGSMYRQDSLDNGDTLTIRISDHKANPDYNRTTYTVSVVITRKGGRRLVKEDDHFEITYDAQCFEGERKNKTLREIFTGINSALKTGVYAMDGARLEGTIQYKWIKADDFMRHPALYDIVMKKRLFNLRPAYDKIRELIEGCDESVLKAFYNELSNTLYYSEEEWADILRQAQAAEGKARTAPKKRKSGKSEPEPPTASTPKHPFHAYLVQKVGEDEAQKYIETVETIIPGVLNSYFGMELWSIYNINNPDEVENLSKRIKRTPILKGVDMSADPRYTEVLKQYKLYLKSGNAVDLEGEAIKHFDCITKWTDNCVYKQYADYRTGPHFSLYKLRSPFELVKIGGVEKFQLGGAIYDYASIRHLLPSELTKHEPSEYAKLHFKKSVHFKSWVRRYCNEAFFYLHWLLHEVQHNAKQKRANLKKQSAMHLTA